MKSQYQLQEIIQDKTGIEVTNCGNCGQIVLYETTEGEITCPHCDYIGDPCDFPDLYYPDATETINVFKELGDYFRPQH